MVAPVSPARRPTAAELMTGKARPGQASTPRPAPRADPAPPPEAEIRTGRSDLPSRPPKRPSAVSGLQRGIGANQAEPATPEIRLAQTDLHPRPEKPVRFTLDLDRERHAYLKSFGVIWPGVAGSDIIRALLDELRDDPELVSRVDRRVVANLMRSAKR